MEKWDLKRVIVTPAGYLCINTLQHNIEQSTEQKSHNV